MSNIYHQSSSKKRLDQEILRRKMAQSRSSAENLIKLGKVKLNNKVVQKPATLTDTNDVITIQDSDKYVSRAALKLKSATQKLQLNFEDLAVLDVGSSTGGFTQFALESGAKKVIAIDVGTEQLHPSLRGDLRIKLYEKTDIRDVRLMQSETSNNKAGVSIEAPDIVLIDVSFISLKDVLPSISKLVSSGSQIVAMCKPQFEASPKDINKGIVKNDTIRRKILKNFEKWLANNNFIIISKADSDVAGAKGNIERFYVLKTL